jgi:beta-glucosidase-like glycosyl hydrolase
LTFWTPNINIFRDPRWGRGQETPGEDPYLTSEYVAVYMHALQYGDDPNYLKMSGCCKHFVAYSFDNYNGTDRHHFNAVVTEQDLADTYYPAFQSCVQRGEASSVMCSYNEVNGIPSCANFDLLTVKLRQQWGFDGYITSDCGAVDDIQENHNYTNTTDDTVRVALSAGMDLCCGPYLAEHGFQAYTDKAISEADIDAALTHQFTVQMRLGLWDPPANQIYKTIPVTAINTLAHQLLALDAARQGLVLLKNNGNVLPLNAAQISKLVIVGPNGDMHWEMLGNYHGFPPFVISPLDGIRSYVPNGTSYIPGCTINGTNKDDFPQAIAAASAADATILVVGLDQTQERENCCSDQTPSSSYSFC